MSQVTRINQAGASVTSGFINMANSAGLSWDASAGVDGTLTYSASNVFTFTGNVASSVIGSNGQSLGTFGSRWGTLFSLSADLSSTLLVAGTAIFQGNTSLGNSSLDTIQASGRWISSLVPLNDGTIDLGSVTDEWRDLYIDGTAFIDTASIGIINSTITFIGTSTSINSSSIFIGDSSSN